MRDLDESRIESLFQSIQSFLDFDDVPVLIPDPGDLLTKGEQAASNRPTDKITAEGNSLWITGPVVEDVGMSFEESKRHVPVTRFPSDECPDDGP